LGHGRAAKQRPALRGHRGPQLDTLFHFANGMNTCSFAKANPAANSDPLGLAILPSLVVDNLDDAIRYYDAYQRGRKAIDIVKQLVLGASMESVVMGLAFDYAAGKFGGAAMEKVLGGAAKIMKNVKPWLKRANTSITWGGKELKFNSLGFPDFGPFVHVRVPIRMTGNNKIDQELADKALKELGQSKPPGRWVWHHHEDLEHMELVPFDLNDEVEHFGGASIIRAVEP
jgi:hypothetical protein